MQPKWIVSVRAYTVLLLVAALSAILLFGVVVAAITVLNEPYGELLLIAAIVLDVIAVLSVLFVRVCIDVDRVWVVEH